MVPQHNLKSKNIKEKSGSQSGHPVEIRIRTFDEPERRCREAREVMKKRGFPEREPAGKPEKRA